MTKTRAPLTLEDRLHAIIGALGAEACAAAYAEATGRTISTRTIYNWSDPDTPERIPADAVIPLDLAWQAAGQEGAPLYETITVLFDAARAERFACAAALARHAIDVIKEGGEAHAALVAAAQPGATDRDRREAAREASEAIAALTRTLPLLTTGAGPNGTSDEGPGKP